MRARLFLIGPAYSKWFPTFKIMVSWAYTGEAALEIPHILLSDRMSAGLAIEKPPDFGIGQNKYNYQHHVHFLFHLLLHHSPKHCEVFFCCVEVVVYRMA